MPLIGDVPENRVGSSIVYYNGAIYLFGTPWNTDDETNESSLYAFNLTENTWKLVPVIGNKPSSRTFHNAFIYKNEMFILYGFLQSTQKAVSSIWKFNFASSSWVFVSDNSTNFVISNAYIQIDSLIYQLFGTNLENSLNSLSVLNLSQAVPEKSYLSNNWDSPGKRKNHCSIRINDFILIFGGVSDTGIYLNDMWKYDITLNTWTVVVQYGDIPSPRELFSYIKIISVSFIIYGGKDDNSLFRDMYYFSSYNSYWVLLSDGCSGPTPRFSTCITPYMNYEIIITGGQDDVQFFDEIWSFSYITGTFSLLNTNDKIKPLLANHKCWSDTENYSHSVYLVGGNSYYYTPNPCVYQIIIDSVQLFSITTILFNATINFPSFAALVPAGSYVYILFGSYWNIFSSSRITALNYKTGQTYNFM